MGGGRLGGRLLVAVHGQILDEIGTPLEPSDTFAEHADWQVGLAVLGLLGRRFDSAVRALGRPAVGHREDRAIQRELKTLDLGP